MSLPGRLACSARATCPAHFAFERLLDVGQDRLLEPGHLERGEESRERIVRGIQDYLWIV
jgi:hypothetical protein